MPKTQRPKKQPVHTQKPQKAPQPGAEPGPNKTLSPEDRFFREYLKMPHTGSRADAVRAAWLFRQVFTPHAAAIPFPVFSVCSDLGFHPESTAFPGPIDARITDDGDNRSLTLSRSLRNHGQRIAAAAALGIWAAAEAEKKRAKDSPWCWDYRKGKRDPRTAFGDMFAHALLCPEKDLKARAGRLAKAGMPERDMVRQLCAHYQVPVEDMEYLLGACAPTDTGKAKKFSGNP